MYARALAALPVALLLAAATEAPDQAVTHHAARDVIEQIRSSPLVIRGVVQGGPSANAKDTIFPVHVDAWLKGEGPTDIKVDFGRYRPVTSEGQAELLLLAPQAPDAGSQAAYRSVGERTERWEVPHGATAAADQAVRDIMSGAPEPRILAGLVATGPVLARQAASRLALLASGNPAAAEAAEAAARNPLAVPEARAELLRTVPSRLSPETLVLAADPSQPPPVRLAAIEGLSQTAVNEPARRPAALPVLRAAAAGDDLRLKLAGAAGLARLGQPEALKPLDQVLASSEQPLRLEALRSLVELARQGNAEAEARLRALGNDPDPQVSKSAQTLAKGLPPPAAPARSPVLPIAGGAVVVVIILAAAASRRRKGGAAR